LGVLIDVIAHILSKVVHFTILKKDYLIES